MAMNGIDVSSNQPANICDLVAYDFAIVKATGNPSGMKWNYTNPYMRQQVDSALAKTGCAGLYHFTYGRDANEEADLFCDHVKDYVGRAVLVIDYEGDSALGRGREWLRTMIRRIKERTGVNPIVYTSSSVIKNQDIVALCKEENCGIWSANYYAGYKAINGYSYGNLKMDIPQSVIWQYTSTGYLQGYSEPLDLDVFFGDKEAWLAYAKGDGTYTPPESGGDGAQGTYSIAEDGIWSTETTKALQGVLDTPIDGEIWGQNANTFNAVNKGGLLTASWKMGNGGSEVIRALQRLIGMTGDDVDGRFGAKTCRNLQKWLGTPVDGEVWKPSAMVRELQRRINAGTLA